MESIIKVGKLNMDGIDCYMVCVLGEYEKQGVAVVDVVLVNTQIQLSLGVLLVYFILCLFLYCVRKGKHIKKLVAAISIVCFCFVWRYVNFEVGGFVYAGYIVPFEDIYYYSIEEGYKSSLNSYRFISKYFSNNELNEALPLDRIEFSLKEDLSGVSFLDVFLCRNYKWIDSSRVESTEYIVFDGKDAEIIREYVGRGMKSKHYLKYKDGVYLLNYKDKIIQKDKKYVLMYDMLALDRAEFNMKSQNCYTVSILEEYNWQILSV